jgi:hypothetical protein
MESGEHMPDKQQVEPSLPAERHQNLQVTWKHVETMITCGRILQLRADVLLVTVCGRTCPSSSSWWPNHNSNMVSPKSWTGWNMSQTKRAGTIFNLQ